MGVLVNEYYKGKGTAYLRRRSGTDGLLPIGNASEIALAFSINKQEMKDYENAGGATADTATSIESATANITLMNLNPTNIARVTAGTTSVVEAGAVTAEAHTVGAQGSFVKFDKIPDTSGTITVTGTGGTPAYVEGTDYETKNGGILILEGDIAAAAGIEVNYTAVKSRVVQSLMEIGEEYEMYFDGLNEARSGKASLATMHRVKVNPTQGLPLISDDYASLQFTVDILRDDTVTGSDKSKYVMMEYAE